MSKPTLAVTFVVFGIENKSVEDRTNPGKRKEWQSRTLTATAETTPVIASVYEGPCVAKCQSLKAGDKVLLVLERFETDKGVYRCSISDIIPSK